MWVTEFEPEGMKGMDMRKSRVPNTQEEWRKFWRKKQKKGEGSDLPKLLFACTLIVGLFLLAVFLPQLGYRPLVNTSAVMNQRGEEPEFNPALYEDYVPIERQVQVLRTLGFEISDGMIDEVKKNLEQDPMLRVYVEGYPYKMLLAMLSEPVYEEGALKVKEYSEQGYWFDWESRDIDMGYVHILEGVNAMGQGDFAVTEMAQDMSNADWKKEEGTIKVGFSFNGIPCEYKIRFQGDWLDFDIIGQINSTLEQNGIEKRIYFTDDNGQGCVLLYRDKEWADQFKEETGITLQ